MSRIMELQTLLNISLMNETLVASVDNRLRGEGKTTLLIKASLENNVPILIKHREQLEHIKRMDENITAYLMKDALSQGFSATRSLMDGVYIDDGFSSDEIRDIENRYPIIGGFVTI